ncbi:putative 3-hydroxyacyl-CoA dehydrogenase-like protein [Lipomyces tetrasporus]|uniref:3-hydroxyacyl-CoA dehydrogenase-like protein n=1 Tax=Lipomyces tetrasporus TaxID=54092 RepID=A0AAD7QQQ0_9ASCO|nr:putative 3-hydroxyacyl-CoA dehydrogenase-like protein [Lipomyces tetrasporus]KAJ8099246.1 putative 3-hydroxyacyl-CoA dehydrogenase-like protein [Lipomyces tetrasporus]
MKIKGRTFILTGGASGLGLGTAQELASQGGYVAILDRDEEAGKRVMSGTFSYSKSVRFFTADVSDAENLEKAVDAAVTWTKETGKPLGGAVSAAGVAWTAKTLDRSGNPSSISAFKTVMDVNVIGTYSLCSLVASRLAAQPLDKLNEDGERGVIILVSSVSALEGRTGQVAYGGSKGAVASMTLPMARDLAPWGIRVVALAPAVFDTAMTAAISKKTKNKLAAMLEFPRRFGQASEFAKMVSSVIQNVIVNGAIIRLDGASRMGKL